MNYKYSLERTSKKYHCPNCEKKTFTKYVDNENDEYINDKVGICDRQSKCGYHYTPKSFFRDNNIDVIYKPLKRIKTIKKETSYISADVVKKSLNTNNNFITYLHKLFDTDTVDRLVQEYKIGTSNYWNNATVFWQIDKTYKVRTGKVMLYKNGKRVKKPFNHIGWLHKILKYKDFELKQCLFGEHLISNKVIGIVESEKTAIICSGFYPNMTWLATGGLNNLNKNNTSVLKDHKVTLYPDSDCIEKWDAKANQIGLKCIVSDILKDEKKGIDLADMYIAEKTNDVNLLAEYFNNAQLPKELKIDSYTIKNVKSFIDENIKIIKSYSDWDRKPFLKRLYYIKEIVKKYNLKYVA